MQNVDDEHRACLDASAAWDSSDCPSNTAALGIAVDTGHARRCSCDDTTRQYRCRYSCEATRHRALNCGDAESNEENGRVGSRGVPRRVGLYSSHHIWQWLRFYHDQRTKTRLSGFGQFVGLRKRILIFSRDAVPDRRSRGVTQSLGKQSDPVTNGRLARPSGLHTR